MKSLFSSAVALVALSLPAVATLQISVINTDLETYLEPVLSSAGVPYTQGSATVGVGFFNISDAEIQQLFAIGDVASLSEAFVSHGVQPTVAFGGGGDLAGVFTAAFDEAVTGAPKAGSNVYVVIGQGDSLFGGSELLVFKSNTVFTVDTALIPTNVSANLRSTLGSVIVGSFGGSFDAGVGLGAQPHFSTAQVIPEPSTVALLGLGALAGFVAFRRRR